MSLDLGALVGHVIIESASAEAKITTLLRQFGELGTRAEAAGAGTAVLDRELVSVATAATQAAAGLDRTSAAARTTAETEDKAAASAAAQAQAVARLAGVMEPLAGATAREQQAQLRLIASQERLDALMATGTATTRQLASAQAGLVGSQRAVIAAQEAAAKGTSRWGTAMAGVVKTAGALGLIVGVLAAAKAAIDITKEANNFQRDMVMIQTNADVTAAEVHKANGALLDMAGPVAAGPADLAVAFYHAKSVGLDYAKALDTTRIAAEGAKVGHGDLEQTMNALTSTVASGIPGVQDMSGAMGQLIAIVGTGDMKLTDLNQALGSGILTVVKGYGLSLTDVGAALATFGDNNIRGADAATMLRMAVQAMAVPAKGGRAELEALGLSADQLAKDMQTGGLNKAILDLKSHLDAAGITSVQVGAVLTEVFGKRAGPGVAVLVGQVDRLQSKFAILRDSGASFGDKWTATTQTASFALSRFGHMLEAAGIQLTEKLGPDIAEVVGWLTTTLPHAVGVLQSTLGPLEHIVGIGLVGAWHLLVMTLTIVKDAIAGIGSLLKDHKDLLTAVGTAVAVMWLAYKGYGLAVNALRTLSNGLQSLAAKAIAARDSMVAASESASTMGVAADAALGVIGVAVGIATIAWVHHADAVAAARARVDELTEAYKLDNGALADNTTAAIANQLQKSGAATAARNLGLNLKDLTLAAEGNTGAIGRINAAYDDYKKHLADTIDLSNNGTTFQKASASAALEGGKALSQQADAWEKVHSNIDTTNGDLKTAVQKYKDLAALTAKQKSDAKAASPFTAAQIQFQKDLATAQKETQIAIDGVTYAMKGQATEADILNAAIARLSGDKNAAAESQLALADSLGSVTDQIKEQAKQFKDHGTSLNKDTAEGRKNLEWLHQQIDQVNSVASAQIKAGASTQTVTDTLGKNEKALRDAAVAAGLNADQVDALLKLYAATPAEVKTLIKANTDDAATKALTIQKKLDNLAKQRIAVIKIGDETGEGNKHIQDQLDALTQPRVIPIKFLISESDLRNRIAGAIVNGIGLNAGGTDNWRGGLTWVGEKGPELLDLPPGSRITEHNASVRAATAAASLPVPTTAPSMQAAWGGSSGVDNRRYVHIDKLNVEQKYPRPDTGKIALPHAMLAAEHAMGGL